MLNGDKFVRPRVVISILVIIIILSIGKYRNVNSVVEIPCLINKPAKVVYNILSVANGNDFGIIIVLTFYFLNKIHKTRFPPQ